MKTVEMLRTKAANLLKKAESLVVNKDDSSSDTFAMYLKAKEAYQGTKKEHRKIFNAMLKQRATAVGTILVSDSRSGTRTDGTVYTCFLLPFMHYCHLQPIQISARVLVSICAIVAFS